LAQETGALVEGLGKAGPSDEESPLDEEELRKKIRIGASIFKQYCFVCHGNDGTGSVMRAALPPIPDFTSAAFHKEHTDAQLMYSILDGKGTLMPANRGRVTEEQAGYLVAYIRAFGPPMPRPIGKRRPKDREFDEIVRQWNELNAELKRIKNQK
jgi:mono/diheme cytochrome c family protein